MGKKKFSIYYILLVVFIILIIFAVINNVKYHHEKEYQVLFSKILESAKECYLKEECNGNITLKDLYDKNYLETQVDPSTKENMDETLCIKWQDGAAKFCE